MEYTDDVDAFPEESQAEIEAVDSLRDDIDEDEINFRKLFNRQLEEAEAWQNTDQKYRKRLHAKLRDVYTLYILAHRNPKRERLVERKCDELKIANTEASHLAIRIVKLILRPSDKTAYQYASVLRYASLKDIAPEALAEALAKKGNGIDWMAVRFSKEYGTNQRAAVSDSGGRSTEPDDYDMAPDASNDNDDDSDGLADDNEYGEAEEDDAASNPPEVYWGQKALKQWRKSEADGGAWFFVEWRGKHRARIRKKTLPK